MARKGGSGNVQNASWKGDIFIKFNFMEVNVMRGFTIAIMLVVAFYGR